MLRTLPNQMTKKKKTLKKDEIMPRIVRTCHDEDCPKCGFPETIIVRNAKTFRPLWIECSKRDCSWGKKIISLK